MTRVTAISETEFGAMKPEPVILPEARAQIARAANLGGKWLVILDDDPTGSQSVQDIPVITDWTDQELEWAFSQPATGFFILTNSRAMPESTAKKVLSEIVSKVEQVAKRQGLDYSFVMRTDSTLRGHFELESNLLLEHARSSGHPYDLMVFVPAYIDAGRATFKDMHWVHDGTQFVPVAETDYAKDSAFGFKSSSLAEYIQERTSNRILAESVQSISLEDIRLGGVELVARKLESGTDGQIFIINAAHESDLDIVALAALEAERNGKQILYRTGPSFVASRLGLRGRGPLSHDEIFSSGERPGHGLIVVGSHVEITNKQLAEVAQRSTNLHRIDVDVAKLLTAPEREIEIQRCVAEAVGHLRGSEVLLVTSRKTITGLTSDESLQISQVVSDSLVEITKQALAQSDVAWLIAKGGITSSDIITKAVQSRRAVVAGQLFPGIVSVWVNQGPVNSKLSGLPLVVFAGNVGNEHSLADAIEILRGGKAQ